MKKGAVVVLCKWVLKFIIPDAGGSWAVLFRIRTLSVPRVLLQSDFNRQKRSLENFSLPLVTLWKRV